MELQEALFTSQQDEIDWIIEVDSCIDANATFHRLSDYTIASMFTFLPVLPTCPTNSSSSTSQ